MRFFGFVVFAALALAACSGTPPAPEPEPPLAPIDTLPPPEPEPPPVVEAPEPEPEPDPAAVLMDRVFAAMGGREAWRGLNSYSTAGTSTVETTYGPTTIDTKSLVSGLSKIRAEQDTPVGDVLVRVDGETASLVVDGSPRDPGPGFSASVRSQLLFSLPYVLMNADSLQVSRGDDTPDGLAVLVYRAPGVEAAYEMIVGSDGRPVRIESVQPGPAGSARMVHAIAGYREAGALLVPTGTTQTSSGRRTGASEITVFTPNPEIPAGAFGG